MSEDLSKLRKHPRVNVEFFADWGWGPECGLFERTSDE
jgi:hypothetical protein